jgi:hypothetical protein
VKKLILSLLALVVLLAANCNQPPVPPPSPVADAGPPVVVVPDAAPAPTPAVDAGPAPVPLTPVGAACFNLASIPCSEGVDPHCVAVTQRAIDAQLTKVDLPCLTKAKTPKAAAACGFVACK